MPYHFATEIVVLWMADTNIPEVGNSKLSGVYTEIFRSKYFAINFT
jgi:hypothetical protein